MPTAMYDRDHAALTVHCYDVPSDTLHLYAIHNSGLPWFSMNTKYLTTRITVAPTREDLERIYNELGRLLGKVK